MPRPKGYFFRVNLTFFIITLIVLGGVGFGIYWQRKLNAESNFNDNLNQANFNLNKPVNLDPDGDGLSDSLEMKYGTDPFNADTDGDGYSDGLEVISGYNPKGAGKL